MLKACFIYTYTCVLFSKLLILLRWHTVPICLYGTEYFVLLSSITETVVWESWLGLLLSSLTMNECMLCTAQGAKIKYYDTMRPYEKLVYKKCYKVQTIECSHICDQQNVTIVLIMYWLSDWSHTYMTTFNGLHFVAYFSYGLIVS